MKIVEINKNSSLEKLEQIIHIEKECFGMHGAVDIWILRPLARFGKVYVLEKNNNIYSIAEFIVNADKEAFLYGLCTTPNFRNHGFATQLLLECEKILKNLNIKSISLTVSPQNIVAIKLYEELHYKKIYYSEKEYGTEEPRFIYKKNI